MSPFFGNKADMVAQQAAVQTEYERLSALPVADLAAEILPAFGGQRPANGPITAGAWLMGSFPRGQARATCVRDLQRPVLAAIQALEHAGLLEQDASTFGPKARLGSRSLSLHP